MLKKLVETADVLLENFRPDVKTRLGIDYETLSKINPRLVYASISGFGQTGPYATRPGFDQIAQGMGGLMSVTGLPGQGPLRVGIPIADLCGGIFAAYGVTVALLEREHSGKGQWLHTSLLEAMMYMMDFQTARWTIDGEIPGRRATSIPPAFPPASTRPATATSTSRSSAARSGSASPRRWARPSGSPTSARRPRPAAPCIATGSTPRSSSASLRNTSDYWIETLNEAGVACGRINNLKEVFEEPQVQHLGILKKVTSKHLGEQTLMGQPVTLDADPFDHRARGAEARRALGGNPSRDRLRPRRPVTHESRRSLLT